MNDLSQDGKLGSRRRSLGRGLSSLIPESAVEVGARGGEGLRQVPIEHLTPAPFQPRRRFAEEELEGLADSIRTKGVMQPLLVRPVDRHGEAFEIIAGERRWRAAQRAGLHELPVIVHDLSDRDTLEVALLENVQRQDLSPLEEAEGYQRLIDEFGHTQQELADTVGKSRSHIANLMRLLTLPRAVCDLIEEGSLSAGHARALLGAADPAALARTVVARGLNVRQTEALAKLQKSETALGIEPKTIDVKDADTRALEQELSSQLGLKVTLKNRGKGGVLAITYGSLDQLDGLLRRLR
jgi:ParB family chromosome partitioning protein